MDQNQNKRIMPNNNLQPRIIPLQLLTCLKVLLDDKGGILNRTVVKRIAGLMTKYSKKLVSKCIYVLILKTTKTELLDDFMASTGWMLVYSWLLDAQRTSNWPLAKEILELLLLSPVDVHRLKTNAAPKLVKALCKESDENVPVLAKRLVDQWLKIVTETPGTQVAMVKVAAAAASAPALKYDEKKHLAREEVDGPASTSTTADNSESSSNSSPRTASYMVSPASTDALKLKFCIKDKNKREEPGANAKTAALSNGVNGNVTSSEAGKHSAEDQRDILKENVGKSKEEGGRPKDKDRSSDKHSSSNHKSSSSSKSKSSSKSSSSKTSSSSSSHRSHSLGEKSRDKHRHSSNKDKNGKEDKGSSSGASGSKDRSSSVCSSSSNGKERRESMSSNSSGSSKHKERRESICSSSNKHKSSSSSSSHSKSSRSSSSNKEHRRSDSEKKVQSAESTASPTPTDIKANDKAIMPPPPTIIGATSTKEKPTSDAAVKPKSTTFPPRKPSFSIEPREEGEKIKTVKTYNSQFRTHGLTVPAPPPPSRKGLKKPSSAVPPLPSIPPTIVMPTLKRSMPPLKSTDGALEKKIKLDLINSTTSEKPGAIKLIPPKKPPTLVESNIFGDALIVVPEVKKTIKRRRTTLGALMSPDATKTTAPLKFYQDTLEDPKIDGPASPEKEEAPPPSKISSPTTNTADTKEADEDEDDIPLKKVKEDLDKDTMQARLQESNLIESSVSDHNASVEDKSPGPGCGPDGPPGILVLHRRSTLAKKKLRWQEEEKLVSVRTFEVDVNERVNVTKQGLTFKDMKERELMSERNSMSARRNMDDFMEAQMEWRPLIVVDNVLTPPLGKNSKEREVQAKRELHTLRALYFSPQMIPESPAEPMIEPLSSREPKIIPLDDLVHNIESVTDYSKMPWPEPRDLNPDALRRGLINNEGLPVTVRPGQHLNLPMGNNGPMPPFMPFGPNFNGPMPANMPMPNNIWPNQPRPPLMGMMPGPLMGNNNFNGPPNMPIGGPNAGMMSGPGPGLGGPGPFPGPGMPPGNFMGPPFNGPLQFNGPNQPPPFGGGPPQGFPGMNFGPMMNAPPNAMHPGMMNGMPNNNNSNNNRGGPGGGNWRMGNPNAGGNNWRPGGSNQGPNNADGNAKNSGVCKNFVRGYCRNGNTCKYIHPPGKRL